VFDIGGWCVGGWCVGGGRAAHPQCCFLAFCGSYSGAGCQETNCGQSLVPVLVFCGERGFNQSFFCGRSQGNFVGLRQF